MNRESYILENSASAIVCRDGVRRIVAIPETSVIYVDRPFGKRHGLVEVVVDKAEADHTTLAARGARRAVYGPALMLVQDILGRGKPLAIF